MKGRVLITGFFIHYLNRDIYIKSVFREYKFAYLMKKGTRKRDAERQKKVRRDHKDLIDRSDSRAEAREKIIRRIKELLG